MFPAGDLLPNLGLPIVTTFLAVKAQSHGGFGLVGGGITIPYHPADLSLIRPCIAFTNHYRRGRGLGRDLSIGEVAHIITHYNDGGPQEPYGVAHTVGKVSKRFFSSGRSACKKQSMVADLVGQ